MSNKEPKDEEKSLEEMLITGVAKYLYIMRRIFKWRRACSGIQGEMRRYPKCGSWY
jgi:hypothetical protein